MSLIIITIETTLCGWLAGVAAKDHYRKFFLGRKTAYSIKKSMVKELWEEIIENHLQPHNCLNRQIDNEIRNDNDLRFITAVHTNI